jgi:ribonuclease HI
MHKIITPFRGTGWPYSQLVAPSHLGGFKQPLRDPWVFGTSLLLKNFDFSSVKSEDDLPWLLNGRLRIGSNYKSNNYNSPLISDHKNLTLMEFLGPEYLDWDGHTPLLLDKKSIKSVAIKRGLLLYRGPFSKTIKSKDFYHHVASKYALAGSSAASISIDHFSSLPRDTPAFLISHYIKALCNALNTDSRRRDFDPECSSHPKKNSTNKWPCYFCDGGDLANPGDRCKHIFFTCPIVKKAISAVLRSPEGPNDPDFTRIFDLKATPLYILDFPLTKLKYSRLSFIMCALWAIWDNLSQIKKGRSKSNAASRIEKDIIRHKNIWSAKKRNSTTYGNASTRSDQQKAIAFSDASKLIASLPDNAILVFTDGSALGNPGPAGAGAFITVRSSPHSDYRLLHPLGHSTNNAGELWAIGMALSFIKDRPRLKVLACLSPIYVLTDSLFAINAISKGYTKVPALKPVVKLLRELLDNMPGYNKKPKLYWIPGHAGVMGNETADSLATSASSKSKEMYGDFKENCLEPKLSKFLYSVV